MNRIALSLRGLVVFVLVSGLAACERESPETTASSSAGGDKMSTAEARGYQIEYLATEMAKAFYDQESATFVDVRGDHAFEIEHIVGAQSHPLTDIKKGILPDLPKDSMLVLYCGCPHSMSSEAAHLLQKRGFSNVYVLDEGYYHWKEQGYPIKMDEAYAATLKHMTIRGSVAGVAPGTPVYAGHEPTGQLEAGEVDDEGNFEMHLPFYALDEGAVIQVFSDGMRATVPFSETEATVELK